MKRILFPALISWLIFLFFYSFMLSTLESFGGNYSGFLRLRERRANRIPFLTEELTRTLILREKGGYDGQWYYYIAFDPFLSQFADEPELYNDVIDAPPYRYTRIGFPVLTRVFSGGDPFQFPKTMVLLILFFNVLGAVFFSKIIQHFGRSPFWAFLYLLIPSTTTSFNLAVPDSVAMSLLLGGLYFYLKERFPLAVLLFSFAILVRETSLLFVFIVAMLELFQKKRFPIAILLGAAILPLLAWKLFLTWRLFEVYGWETFLYSPGDFTFPFGGIYDLYFPKWNQTTRVRGLAFLPILIILNLLFSFAFLLKKRDFFSISLFTYCCMHVSLNYTKIWGQIRNLERTTSEGFLFLMLCFLAMPAGRPVLRYSIIVAFLVLLVYKAYYSPVATHFQDGFDLLAAFER